MKELIYVNTGETKLICTGIEEYGSNPVRVSLKKFIPVTNLPTINEAEILDKFVADRRNLEGTPLKNLIAIYKYKK